MTSILPLIIQPDADEPGAAEVLVDGALDGHSYRFLLDTGAAVSRVVSDAYTAQFPSASQRQTSGAFSTRRDDLITVPRLTLGPIAREHFTLARSAPEAPQARSLIGMDLLQDFACIFRFTANQLELNPPHLTHDLRDLTLSRRGHPFLDVWLGSVAARAVWDTGAGMTVVDSGFIQRHPGLFKPAGQTEGTDSGGASCRTALYEMAAAAIGGVEFPAQRVAGIDLALISAHADIPLEMIVGYSTMRAADWVFDFPGRQWGVLPEAG